MHVYAHLVSKSSRMKLINECRQRRVDQLCIPLPEEDYMSVDIPAIIKFTSSPVIQT